MASAVVDVKTGCFADALRPITDKEFRLFQKLVEQEAGIHLSDAKRALLVGRLSKRLRELGLRTFAAYYRLVTEEDELERTRMIDRICTNETHFFREPRQFDFLEEHVFPEWVTRASVGQRSKRIRVWSAACSSGEEPYSLAMVLLDRFPVQLGWEVEILGTDLSTRVLDRAQAAVWPIEKSKEIPQHYLKRYMLKGTHSQEGRMKAGPALRAAVRFARLNLNGTSYPAGGPFDLIFCRNVLIYFEWATKHRVVDQLLDLLVPDGYLFLGHAESLSGLSDRVRNVGPTVYTLARGPAVPGRAHNRVSARPCGRTARGGSRETPPAPSR